MLFEVSDVSCLIGICFLLGRVSMTWFQVVTLDGLGLGLGVASVDEIRQGATLGEKLKVAAELDFS